MLRKTTVRTVFDLPIHRGKAGQVLPSPFACGAVSDDAKEQTAEHPTPDPSLDSQGRAGGPDFIAVEVEADGFLYNMVRTIVGTLVEVGRGDKPEAWPAEVLRAADRRLAGPTAPPEGLCLVKVEY